MSTFVGGEENKPLSAVEDKYKQRFEALRSVYEERIASMSAHLRTAFRDIETDQVLAEMRADPASGAFVRARVGEMVEQTIDAEREAHIARLSEQCAESAVRCGAVRCGAMRGGGETRRRRQRRWPSFATRCRDYRCAGLTSSSPEAGPIESCHPC